MYLAKGLFRVAKQLYIHTLSHIPSLRVPSLRADTTVIRHCEPQRSNPAASATSSLRGEKRILGASQDLDRDFLSLREKISTRYTVPVRKSRRNPVAALGAVLMLCFILPFFLYPTHSVGAQFNEQINYQGKLLDDTGTPVADGSYSMVFSLYTVASGGSNIWTETQSVPVTSGLFSAMLGSSTALTGVDFNQTLYLGVNIAGDGEMSPRKVLGAVPAAFQAEEASNAQTLDNLATSSFLRADQADTLEATAASTLLTITQNGTGDLLNLFDGGSEVFTVTDGGNVGIGTTSPAEKLEVAGNIAMSAGRHLYLGSAYLYGDDGEILYFNSNSANTARMTFRDASSNVLGSFYGDNNGTFGLLDADNSWAVQASTDNFIRFRIDNDVKMQIESNGNIGIGTTSPTRTLSVAGDAIITGALYDSTNSAGTSGYVLQTTGAGTEWVATSSLGFVDTDTTLTAGNDGQIPFADINNDDFDYSYDLTFADSTLSLIGSLDFATSTTEIASSTQLPGSIINDTSAPSGDVDWATPSGASADGGSVASADGLDPSARSEYLKATNFGFSIPSGAVIEGIAVDVERRGDNIFQTDEDARLVKGGVVQSENKAGGEQIPDSWDVRTFGSDTDLWNDSWTVTDINDSDFGFAYAIDNGSYGVDVDYISITIYYSLDGQDSLWTMGYASSTGNFIIADDTNTEALTIDTGGNVGIGTSTPVSKLSVAGDIFIDGTATSTFTSNVQIDGTLKVGTSSVIITKEGIQATQDYLVDTGTGNNITFAEKAIFNANVGIGDSTPASLFTVGASDAFQINSSGVVTSGTWNAAIQDGLITEADLDIANAPSDELCLTYEADTANFTWQNCVSGSLTTTDIDTEAELETILTDVTDLFTNNDTIDISNNTNLTAGTNLTLSGDTLNVDDAFVQNTGDTITGDLTFSSATIDFTGSGAALPTDGIAFSTGFNDSVNSLLFGSRNGFSFVLDTNDNNPAYFDIGGVATTTVPAARFGETGAEFAVNLSMTGSAANITLGNNYLSGDGDDEGVFVDSAGNVGIGDTTPDALLDVTGTDTGYLTTIINSSADGYGQYIYVNNADFDKDALRIENNSQVILSVANNGEVGIGTTDPSATLDVTRAVADTYTAEFTNTNADGLGTYTYVGNTDSTRAALAIDNSSGGIFRVMNDGKVGIGTSSPSTKFQLYDGINSVVRTSGTDGTFSSWVDGDSFARLYTYANGTLWWGDGTALQDTNLFRDSANTLRTNDSLVVDGSLDLSGLLYDSLGSAGNSGDVLTRGASGLEWAATSTLGLSTVDFLSYTFTERETWNALSLTSTTSFSATLDGRDIGRGYLSLVADGVEEGRVYAGEKSTFSASATGSAEVVFEPSNFAVGPLDFETADIYNVSLVEATPRDIVFNDDGTKMFLVGETGDDVNVFTLTEPYEIESALFSTTTSISAEETHPTGIAFNNDGTKMYITGRTGDDVNEYALSTAFDPTTKSFTHATSVAAQDSSPEDVMFNPDGTKMYISGDATDDVFEYSLSTAFDVSTASYVDNLDMSSYETYSFSFEFNHDGTVLWVGGYNDINTFSLSTPYDISTGSFKEGLYHVTEFREVMGLILREDDNVLYAMDWLNDNIYKFNLAAPGRISNFVASTSVSAQTPAQSHGMTFNDDGTKFYILDYGDREVDEYSLSTAYDITTKSYVTSRSVNTNGLSGMNPCGIRFNDDGTKAFVGNCSQNVYQYSLSTPYDISTMLYEQRTYATGGTYMIDVRFNPSGTEMFTLHYNTSDRVRRYTLSNPWDIETAEYIEEFTLGSQSNGTNYGFVFSPDGKSLAITEDSASHVEVYTMAEPYDIANMIHSHTNELNRNLLGDNSTLVYPEAIEMSPDGRYLYFFSPAYSAKTVFQFDMGTSTPDLIAGYASITLDPEANGADLAEYYPTADRNIGAGDIVSFIDEDTFELTYATSGSQFALAGVISTNPGITLTDGTEGGRKAPLALTGRVPVKVSTENGIVMPGDRITPSSVPGVGMKAGPFDESVGFAITGMDTESLDENRPMQQIILFVDLQEGVNVTNLTETLFAGASTTFMMEISSTFATTTGSTTTEVIVTEAVAVSIWDRLANLASRFVDGVLTLVGLKAEEICLTDAEGETCIDRSDLNALLGSESVPAEDNDETNTTEPENATTTPSAETATTTEEVSNITSSEPADELIEEPTTTTQTIATSTPETDESTDSQEQTETATSTTVVTEQTQPAAEQESASSSTEVIVEEESATATTTEEAPVEPVGGTNTESNSDAESLNEDVSEETSEEDTATSPESVSESAPEPEPETTPEPDSEPAT
jgi:6-phosphogluconolactonase (cycloisomerase 2 family)